MRKKENKFGIIICINYHFFSNLIKSINTKEFLRKIIIKDLYKKEKFPKKDQEM